ncbi:hypothetical protein [Solimonas marina]|uniref:PEGA domain-containing protein n=1 Tax=Solimonas marina TaxID=2714601 RepID=A0A969WH22_9GAMM|nr:hypothetical protein [Solimonas marina]NKF24540.1 hypothetical protein [Solimonas marina]
MRFWVAPFLLLAAPLAQADDSILRVDCMEQTEGAKVYLDDEYRFDCSDYRKEPIGVAAGTHTLRVVKPIDDEHEQIFTQTLTLATGVPQRVRVTLPAATLTAYGVEMKQKREEAARLAQEQERQRKLQLAVESDQNKAASGDIGAMRSLASRYTDGNGVAADAELAKQWQQKADAAQKEKDRQKKLAALQQRLDENDYFHYVRLTPWMLENRLTEGASTYVTLLPFATVMDLISVPTVYSTRRDIYKNMEELETHAARWANPSALVGKAYADK